MNYNLLKLEKRDDKEIIICTHCKRRIRSNIMLEGLSVICPHCCKPM